MELFNILVLWLTLGLIMIKISSNQADNQAEDEEEIIEEREIRKNIFSGIIEKIKLIRVKNKLKDDKSDNSAIQNSDFCEDEMQTLDAMPISTPEIKEADIFVADIEVSPKENNEHTQNIIMQESIESVEEIAEVEEVAEIEKIAEPEVEEIEEIDEEIIEDEEGIMTTAEVEDEVFDIEVEDVTDDFFIECDDEECEYNSFIISEEPWYEHPSVRQLIDGDNTFFERVPRKFEIIEKSY